MDNMAAEYSKGDWVWVSLRLNNLPFGAKIHKIEGTAKITVIDDDDKKHTVNKTCLKPMHASCIYHVEDMINLEDTEESAILRNLHIRYKEQNIYTYTGAILAAVNPYKALPIYTAEYMTSYTGRQFGELPPHIFAMADNAYHNMNRYKKDQSIIISGESGAGKTENTKLLLQFLAAASGQHSWIEQQILESNIVLEAFGNAKTSKNNNSSRFGKYIIIEFNSKSSIESARIEEYLLEKSRIVHQLKDDRNYHIFYCMIKGMSQDEKSQLHLAQAKEYNYLNQGGKTIVDGREDTQDYVNIKSAMKVLMFSDEDIWSVFKTLACVVHLGNITYKDTTVNFSDAVVITDRHIVDRVARFLQVSSNQLTDALTSRTIHTSGEVLTKPLQKIDALDRRDALAKGIYGRLFEWIVDNINKAIGQNTQNTNTNTAIGLLDIFGFESFGVNSFEQLCINYANECLQQFFVAHVFKLEQADYIVEGVTWDPVDFVDNRPIISLIVQQRLSVINLLDEESLFPNGKDSSLLTKLHQHHEGNDHYVKPKSEANLQFGIKHFAGLVTYSTTGFLEKNRDTFGHDLMTMVKSSKSRFIQQLLKKDSDMSRSSLMLNHTVSAQFIKSLSGLTEMLEKTQPFFVRCIKPNTMKRPLEFDRDLCVSQIKYSGMLETLQIRKNGYPVRPLLTDFVNRYRILCSGIGPSTTDEDYRNTAMKICQYVLEKDDYALGKTKVFLKDGQDAFLEQRRDRFVKHKVIYVQKVILGFIQRLAYKKQQEENALRKQQEKSHKKQNVTTEDTSTRAPYNLRKFSVTHFNIPAMPEPTPDYSEDDVYSHTTEIIRKPMLTKLQSSETLSEIACECFLAILKYMGDYPTSRDRGEELTDLIFGPPTDNAVLIDEIYCQIMKQLTGNNNESSIDRGWELMWLLTGILAPSPNLLIETQKFIRSWSIHELAVSSFTRLEETLAHGSRRQYPPHTVEIQAVQQRVTKLYYKIRFPDDSFKLFKVDSYSIARDVCLDIAKDFGLKSIKGFSLFVEIGNRIISIPTDDFVFDVGKHWTEKLKHAGILKEGGTPKLHFMKKVWINVIPGLDRVSDTKFYYYQESQKYLRGYHLCSKEEALFLAALLYRVNHPDPSKAPKISTVYKEFIPSYMLRKAPGTKWEAKIAATLRSIGKISSDDAKVNFLKTVSKWKTFGCAFFEVRPQTSSEFPELIYLAISAKGMFILDPTSKEILHHYSYSEILHWSNDTVSFHVTVGSMLHTTKIYCRTSLGYKMADLLNSYKTVLDRQRHTQVRTLHTRVAKRRDTGPLVSRDPPSEMKVIDQSTYL